MNAGTVHHETEIDNMRWLADLLGKEEVRKDINFLLQTDRDHNYQDTYLLLRNVQEHES